MNSDNQPRKKANDAFMRQITLRMDEALYARLCKHLRKLNITMKAFLVGYITDQVSHVKLTREEEQAVLAAIQKRLAAGYNLPRRRTR